MPGFGDSDLPPEPNTADSLANVVAAALDVLVPPPTGMDLAGFSFGGIIGGLVAARLGRRIRILTLLGAGGLASAQPDLDFRVIPGAGHWTPYEAAEQVNATLCDLLGTHP